MQAKDFQVGSRFRLKQYSEHYEVEEVHADYIVCRDLNDKRSHLNGSKQYIMCDTPLSAFTDAGQIVMDAEVKLAIASAESRMDKIPEGEPFSLEALFETGEKEYAN